MKKTLLIALSLCGFAIGTAQAEVVQFSIGDQLTTLIHEGTFSKGLGEANGKVIASGYGEMKDIKTPIHSENKFNYVNTANAHPTNLGQTTDNSAERVVYYEEVDN